MSGISVVRVPASIVIWFKHRVRAEAEDVPALYRAAGAPPVIGGGDEHHCRAAYGPALAPALRVYSVGHDRDSLLDAGRPALGIAPLARREVVCNNSGDDLLRLCCRLSPTIAGCFSFSAWPTTVQGHAWQNRLVSS